MQSHSWVQQSSGTQYNCSSYQWLP